MNSEQIKTMMAVAWLEFQTAADAHGKEPTERDRAMWEVGFLAGGQAYAKHFRDLLAEKASK